MSTDIQTKKLGEEDSTSGTKSQIGEEKGITQKLADLEERADDVKSNFEKLEQDIEKFKAFVYFIVGAMAIVFAFTSILIGFDYFKNNQDRYEKFIEKTEEIKKETTSEIELQIKIFKDCIYFNGLSQCLR